MTSPVMTVGAQVKAARERAKLSQKQLAKLAKVTQPTVCALENNYDVKLSKVQAVVNALGQYQGGDIPIQSGAPLPVSRPWETRPTKKRKLKTS